MIRRNITLSYILAFSKNTWFWLGIWIFYYLRFTNYAGIGVIETVLILTMTLSEIPTGAVADLMGKKKTLILAFLLETIGALMMATAPNFQIIIWSVFVMCVGGAFYSGTIDALVFDSLKQDKKEHSYSKKISNINTIALIAPAVCGIMGGFMYKISPTLPFYASTFGLFIGFLASFFLIEPQIDTDKFSLSTFLNQLSQGTKELFKNIDIKKQTCLLLSVGFFVVISSEMLDSFLGFEFGFSEIQLGILWSVIYLLSALASQLTPFITRVLKGNWSIIVVGILMAISLIISPMVSLVIGGVSLIFRASLQGIFQNLASISINRNTESKYRATTLSTFNMFKNIPYILTAYLFGFLSDQLSAKTISLYLGITLIILILIQLTPKKKKLTSKP